MPDEFTALTDLQAPGTTVFGYRAGDPVGADVVENWDLRVGVDVREGGPAAVDEPPAPLQRPGPEATHADWQAWAVANGMSEQDADTATLDELQAVDAEPVVQDGGRPADSAKKAEWVSYVQGRAEGDETTQAWAAADSTTKADLQAWQPQPGDTVAVATTEAQA